MAKLILTGVHEAIDLKKLRGEQVLMMDRAAVDSSGEENGLWLIGHRGGVLQFLRSLATCQFYPLKPRRRQPTA